jgi:hypothetical protein
VPVPVTVRVDVLAGADDGVETVRVEPLPAVTEVGLNDAVAPVGSPLTLRLTTWALPDVTAVETL